MNPEDEEQTTHTSVSTSGWLSPGRRAGARILVLAGPEVGRKYVVEGSATIGRASDAAIRVDDPQVSRLHARIRLDDAGGFVVEDLGSRNGTVVNGKTIERHRLSFGDRIQVGSHTVLLFTHQDPLEDKVMQRQKMEAIGRLGAGIAHDFNNLLGAVMASMDYLAALPQERALSDGEVQECLEDIRSAAKRAADLTGRLLGFARRGPQQHGPVEISGLCSEVVHLVRRTFDRSIRIVSEIDPSLYVTGDRAQLYQVLMNLCINSRDAMPRGGTLTISAADAKPEDLDGVPLSSVAKHIVIHVRDTGVGMDAETRKRVFEPFFTTKSAAGSGLGLATVYEVITSHGGHIDVQSEVGAGTTFRVCLPSAERTKRKSVPTLETAALVDAAEGVRTGLILLVDDEEVVRRSAGRLLKQAGHRVTYASDGRQAVDIYRDATPRPDLVILDLDMPNVSGEECFALLREIDPNVRVLFVSGYWDDSREQQLTGLGALGFLRKPYDVATLHDSVHAAMRKEPSTEGDGPAQQGPSA